MMGIKMDYTQEQLAAIRKIQAWLRDYRSGKSDQQVYRVYGYAGTGKTSVAKEAVNVRGFRPIFCAYTGKAAMVLKTKGCPNTSTIHRSIYLPRSEAAAEYRELLNKLEAETDPDKIRKIQSHVDELKKGLDSPSWVRIPKSEFDIDTLFVVDEVSMVDKYIGGDLESYEFPILVLGDPAQLPPIKGSGYFIEAAPDVMLTEIMRQGAQSPVLQIATAIREGKTIPLRQFADSKCVVKVDPKDYLLSDQNLVATNKSRLALNTAIRRARGYSGTLCIGEKLIGLQNNYDVGVMNGSQWEVTSEPELKITDKGHKYMVCDLKSLDFENVNLRRAQLHLNPLLEGTDDFNKNWTPMLTNNSNGLSMTYGYAITVHKSQGSQWDNVLIYDDYWTTTDYKEWLYTAVTRAAKTVTIVRPQQK